MNLRRGRGGPSGILEDIERFPDSSKADIWRRAGESSERAFWRALEDLVASGRVMATGETKARRLSLKPGVSATVTTMANKSAVGVA